MLEQIKDWTGYAELRHWAAFAAVGALSLAILALLQRAFRDRLRAWAQDKKGRWDELLFEALSGPLRLLFFITALAVAGQFAPEEARSAPATTYGLKIALVLASLWLVDRVASVLFRKAPLPGGVGESTRLLLLTVFRIVVVSLGLLIVLDTVGISITPLLASLGVGSVAVALALQETLSNFFSGVYILIDEPFRPGDFIQIDGTTEGYVDRIGWRSVHVRQLSNNTVVIPNSKIAGARLVNYDLPERETSVLVEVGVAYESDLARVEKVACEVAKEVLTRVEGAVSSFEPCIRYHDFGDSSVNFTVVLRARTIVDQYLLKHEFIKALHKRFGADGIGIPYPQRTVHLSKPE